MSEVHADSNERPRCVVMKFGGTSVEDAAAIRRLCQIVNGRLRYHPVVVVSALAKVTDQLFGAGNAAARCDHENACTILQEIEGRHSMLSRELLAAEEGNALCQDLATDFRATYELLASISVARDFSLQAQDHLLGMGEHFSSKIVHSALVQSGLDAVWVDAKDCIVTDAAHTRATPLWEETNHKLGSLLVPLIGAGRIPVLGGFAGSTRDGLPTTLGRGGSDFSAATWAPDCTQPGSRFGRTLMV